MTVFVLQRKQIVQSTLEQAWKFFSNPYNLPKITPPSLNFRITNAPPEVIYPGLMIKYLVSPLLNISTVWVSEITHVAEGRFFVDEQRVGPYSLWHHQHHLRPVSEGVEVEDIVHYKFNPPLLCRILHPILVRPKLEAIFEYRDSQTRKLLQEKFEEPN